MSLVLSNKATKDKSALLISKQGIEGSSEGVAMLPSGGKRRKS
jgi:hypothetical protein